MKKIKIETYDRQVGKTTIATDYINNSLKLGLNCLYVGLNYTWTKNVCEKLKIKTYSPSQTIGCRFDVIILDECNGFDENNKSILYQTVKVHEHKFEGVLIQINCNYECWNKK